MEKTQRKVAVATSETTVYTDQETLVPVGKPARAILIRPGDKVQHEDVVGQVIVPSEQVIEHYINARGTYSASQSEDRKKMMQDILHTRMQIRARVQQLSRKWVQVDMNTKMMVDSRQPIYHADTIINAIMKKQPVQLKQIRQYA